MAKKPWYKEWFISPYYDILYRNRNVEEAEAFVKKLVDYLKPAADSYMFDVACGKGRHSKALADMGFDVTGTDLCLPSIEYAKQFENDHLHFYQHDMRLPFRINYFNYAFNFFTSFGYFKTRREHDDAMRTIAQSLKPYGTFVIDYLNVRYVEENLKRSEELQIGDVNFNIARWFDEEHFFKQIQISDTSKKPQHLFTERVAKFSIGDFTDLLSYQHMQIQHVFGDYDLADYDIRKSPCMIIVASKNK
jgi:SAM-dependent methyltransferase